MQWVLTAIGVLTLAAAVPSYTMDRLPYRVSWGSYVVRVDQVSTGPVPMQRVRIVASSGAVLREISAVRIANVRFPVLARGAPEALWVTAYSGGAHCCNTDYLFTRQGGIRNVLIFDGQNDGIGQLRDLNGDGRMELLAGNDALAYFGDLCYACSPRLVMVIGWDGTRYADMTRRFPAPQLAVAGQYRTELVGALTQPGDEGEMLRRTSLLGYLGASYTVGRYGAARDVLSRVPRSTRAWFLQHEAAMKTTLDRSGRRITVSQQRTLSQ